MLKRWEISRFVVVPFSSSLFAAQISRLILSLALFSGRRSASVAVVLLIIWAVPVGLDQPYASPRWLRAIRAAVSDADGALAHLTVWLDDAARQA